MALEGTIKTPLGTVQKKTALIVGGGAVLVGFIVWYRQKTLGETGDALTTEAIINPATGYPYGSPEDAAALAQQAGFVSPPSGGAPGGSGGYPSNLGYATNGQWTQAVIEYMVGNDLVADPSLLATALGKYITGAYVTDAEVSLVNQGIAVQGFPPIAGPAGYPPSLNRQTTPTTPTPPSTTPVANAATPHIHHITTEKTSVVVQWYPAANAKTYIVYMSSGGSTTTVGQGIKETSFKVLKLKPNTFYSFSVAGVNSAGKRSVSHSNVVGVRTDR